MTYTSRTTADEGTHIFVQNLHANADRFSVLTSRVTAAQSPFLAVERPLLKVDTSGGPVTVVLPVDPTIVPNLIYIVKKDDESTNAVTVVGAGGNTVAGGASYSIPTGGQTVFFTHEGSDWGIISNSYASSNLTPMKHFPFTQSLNVDGAYPYGDGSNPTWASLATWSITCSGPDQGVVIFNGQLIASGVSKTQGLVVWRLDGTIVGVLFPPAEGWATYKFDIELTPPASGFATWASMSTPLGNPDTPLPIGVHTLELLGGWIFGTNFADGWNMAAGCAATFVGFSKSSIVKTA